MVTRLTEGRVSFDSEKQNEPLNPEDCLFQENEFQFWDDQCGSVEELIASMQGHCLVYGACDPSLGKLGKDSDDSAIVTILMDTNTNVRYVIDADIRRRKPDEIIDAIIEYQRLRRFHFFGMETNQFQQFLSDELKRRANLAGEYLSVQDITHVSDKRGRVQKLQPFVSSGMLRLCRRHVTLLEQLRQFPMGAHDDGPDALEMAVSVSTVVPVTIWGGPSQEDEFCDPMDDDRLWTPI
jgi:predicted phage terminase large subunit-like protein